MGCVDRAGANEFMKIFSHDWKNRGLKVPMMGTCSAVLILLFGFGQIASAQPGGHDTIVFVDFEQVFTNFYKTKLANDQLNDMADSINRERAAMVTQYDQLQKEFKEMRDSIVGTNAEEAVLNDMRTKMDEKLVALRRLDEKIVKFNEAQQKRWESQSKRIREGLTDEIRDKMKGYLKAKSYLAVVDSSQINEKNVPSVLFVDDRVDITKDVIDALNK